MRHKWLKLFYALLITFGAQLLGGIFVSSSVGNWYQKLQKPPYTPPDYLFSPVWMILYTLLAISLWLIWINPRRSKKAFFIFGVQLFFNISWSWAFFYMKNPALAFLNITLLWVFIALMFITFYKISHWASYYILPYLAWVGYAVYLNYAFMVLNG